MTELVETMDQAVKAMAHKEGKYLTFSLADEEYGIGILKIKEIIGMMSITTVPQTPEFVKGVINLRGKVIPVIDLRLRFGMEAIDYTERTCIIVVEMDKVVQQNAANAEESASASEELSAQAEQMKGFVEELVALVGGSKNGSRQDTKTRVMAPKAVTGRVLAAPVTKTKAEGTEVVVHLAREVKPEQVIPLSDEDFKDF